MTVETVTIVMRYDCCVSYRFYDIGIYVGNFQETKEILSRNQKCTFYAGPAQNRETLELSCDAPTIGRYLTVQKAYRTANIMIVNEIIVCGFEGYWLRS